MTILFVMITSWGFSADFDNLNVDGLTTILTSPVRHLLSTFTGFTVIVAISLLLVVISFLLFRRLIKIYKGQEEIRMQEKDNLLDDIIRSVPVILYRGVSKKKIGLSSMGVPVLSLEFISDYHILEAGLVPQDIKRDPEFLMKLIADEDRQSFIDENISAFEQLRPFKWEGRIALMGEQRWMRIEANPTPKDNGDIVWTGFLLDTTKQRIIEEDLNRRKEFEKLLFEISISLINAQNVDFDGLISETLGKIGKYCNVGRSYLFLKDEKRNLVSNTHEWCEDGIAPQIENLQDLMPDLYPMWGKYMLNHEVLLIEDTALLGPEWENEKAAFIAQDVKSVVAVPIISQCKATGFVGLDALKDIKIWKDYEIHLLKVFAGLIYNVVEKRKSEQKLLESRQMLRTILDTINVQVFWKDLELKYTGCNKKFAVEAGFNSPEDVIGKTDAEMPWQIEAEIIRKCDLEVIRTEMPFNGIIESTSADGKQVEYKSLNKIPLRDSNDKIFGILGVSQNITSQKLSERALRDSEQKYRAITENAFDGIYLLGLQSFSYVNQRFCEITGYTAQELLDERFDISSIISDESKKIVEDRRKARLERRDIPRTYDVQLKTKSGMLVDVEISTTLLKLDEKFEILGVVRDITERKNSENLLREVAIHKQSLQFKQKFLANMSHEIRTPLTGILGMVELLAKTKLDTEQKDFVSTLRISTENLREISNQILDYSKIEAGKIKLRRDIFNKRVILSNAKKLFESICHKDIILETAIDPEIPEFIVGDEKRVIQILYNLLSNAVKFTFKGKISIEAELKKWIDEDRFLIEIKIIDTGIGINQEYIRSIFQPFEQYDHRNLIYVEGTGLGLSICKELTQLMGGHISAESVEGSGSTFTFSFVAEKADPHWIDKEKESYNEVPGRKNLSILYAEDKVVNQKVVSLMLQSLGHQVVIASNGQEALEKYEQGKFDLILMDIQMPVLGGVDTTRKLRLYYNDLPPIVGLSANAFEGDRTKYMELGMDEYLTKPVKANDFAELIKKLF